MRPLRLKIVWHTLGWSYLSLIIYGSLTPSLPDLPGFPGADKIAHLSAYAVMMLWFGLLYQSRRSLLLLGVSFITLGVVLDLLQGISGYRSMELLDMTANAFGVFLGWVLAKTRLGETLTHFENWIYRQSSQPY